MEPPSGMIMSWFDTLSNFHFLIDHRPGKKHANADALSRCAHAEEPDPDDKPDEMIAMIHEMINVVEPCVPDWDPAHTRSQQLMDSDLEMSTRERCSAAIDRQRAYIAKTDANSQVDC
jgi:hypothetical protein